MAYSNIYFVLAYPQELIEYDLFMKLPTVLIIKVVNQKTHFLKMLKTIYGSERRGNSVE